jgi:Holliday junction DNA helicase RuvA
MITRLTGTLETVHEGAADLSIPAQGLAYQVLIPAFLAPGLMPRLGQTVTFHTLQFLDSPNQGATLLPRLVGFSTPLERQFFELFTTVKGIGNRKALRALAVQPADIARAIQARDARALTQLPEIGQRLADTIVAELHGKVDRFLAPAGPGTVDLKPPPVGPRTAPEQEAIEALIALGETRADAERLVDRAVTAARAADRPVDTPDRLLAAVYAARAAPRR